MLLVLFLPASLTAYVLHNAVWLVYVPLGIIALALFIAALPIKREDGGGGIYAEGSIPATRLTLDMWMKTLPRPWTVAMEATIFTAWIYDHLKPS